ncbi:O-antigen ligase family protein [Qipengyuania sp. CAU 1752]
MSASFPTSRVPAMGLRLAHGAPVWIGIALGVIMPVVSALVYPTYMHQMEVPALEISRLLELPFVVFELAIIFYAYRCGMDRSAAWQALPRDIKFAAVVLLVGVFASSITLSAKPAFSLTMSLITVIHLLFALAAVHLLRGHTARDRSVFLLILGTGLGVLAAYTAWRFAFPPPAREVLGGVIEWHAAVPGFISVRHFGAWTGAITAAFAIRILYFRPGAPLGWDHLLYFLAAALTIWSGTRAAILAIVVAFVAIALIQRRLPSIRDIGIAAILTGLGMCVAWWFIPDDSAFYLVAPVDLVSKDIAGGRGALWAATFSRWLDSPILGWGSGSTFWEVFTGWTHTQPHNVLLQFLISWGAIGAAGGLWLLVRATIAAHRTGRADPQRLALLAMLNALLFQSLFEGMLHYPRFITAIIVLFALLLPSATESGSQRPVD